LLPWPNLIKNSIPANSTQAQHRCGHDGQRKRVAHMPTATTSKTVKCQQIEIGRNPPTRPRDEAFFKEPLLNPEWVAA
jgi:hypothetical protein